ncbi:hypothetical protein [Methylobacterium sp. Leaf85]|uniref:hypothetical protein n=1 Tax=Methylobacterium sp. Leaf85 TaxID=1736241 RepID=UPI000AFA7451|nr:hypothetical protein [Methylobacterium sp. Leaf85]
MAVDLMRLINAKHKLNRAIEHIDELANLLANFEEGGFHTFVLENDDAGKPHIVLRYTDLPVKASIICGEFAYQARSALDIAFVQTAIDNGSTKERLGFPFAKRRIDLLSGKTPQVNSLAEVPAAVRQAVLDFEPHEEEGGDVFLVGLNHICNNDKHLDLLNLTASVGHAMSFNRDNEGSEEDGLLAAGFMGTLAAKVDTLYGWFGYRGEISIPVGFLSCTPERMVEIANRYIKMHPRVLIKNEKLSLDYDVIEACVQIINRVGDVIEAIENSV